MGSAKISVVAVIDLDGKHVRLVVTGPLTMDTQTALHPLIRLGRVLTPVTRVVVDLAGARITEAAAVEALIRQAQEGYIGHPARQVRFALPAPMTMADVEKLRRLRAEQRTWATFADPELHSPVRNSNTAPAQPKATPVTATVRHRHPRASPPRRTLAERDHATATAAQPAANTQHTTIGTVLPFRSPRQPPAVPAQRPAPASPHRTDQGAPDDHRRIRHHPMVAVRPSRRGIAGIPGTWVVLARQYLPVPTPVTAGATDEPWANPGTGLAVLAGHPPHGAQGPKAVAPGLIPSSRDQRAQRFLATRPLQRPRGRTMDPPSRTPDSTDSQEHHGFF